MSKELSGGCDCGAIHYTLKGPVRLVVNCHCNACRKRNGSAYSTYCMVAQENLRIEQGQEHLWVYANNQGGIKHFCAQCGSPLYNINPRFAGRLMVVYGSIAEHRELSPGFNVFCESQLPWVEGIAAIKSFEQSMTR